LRDLGAVAQTDRVQVGDLTRQSGLRSDRIDARQLGLQRLGAGCVDTTLIYAGSIVIADPPLGRTPLRGGIRRHFKRLVQGVEILVEHHLARAIGGAIGGYRVLCQPVAAGVLKEVDARVG